MAGKFINELSSNPPAPEDLVVFFDKSKAVTVQAPLSDVVGAGLNLSAATKGQTAVVDTKVDPISLETIPFLKWEKAGIDFGSTVTKPSSSTDEIITHDPVSGTNGKTTLAELIKSVLPPVTGADAGKQLTVDINGAVGWVADASELPAYTLTDAGKSLLVKTDGTAPEWGSPFPAITQGKYALQTKDDKTGVEWVKSVEMATNLKGGATVGNFFPVNLTPDFTSWKTAAEFRNLVGVPEQLYFPNWAPKNEQVEAGWNDMGVALARLAALVNADTFAGKGSTTTTAANSFPGSGAYVGGVLMPNGKVFCIPAGATAARIYDHATGLITTHSHVFPGNDAYLGGVLMANGKVFMIPANATAARIYDPVADTVTLATGAYPGNFAYAGGVLLPNGKVLCIPSKATAARIYNPTTDTVTVHAQAFSGNDSYGGGVLLPSGKVLLIPVKETKAKIYDPVADTFSDHSHPFPGADAYNRGVLMPNGKAFLAPYKSTTALIYDPIADRFTTSSATFAGGFNHIKAVLLANGKVLGLPYKNTSAYIYDPLTDSVTTTPGVFPSVSGSLYGGVLLPNGDVFHIPCNATQATISQFNSPQLPVIPTNMVTSPFFNKP